MKLSQDYIYIQYKLNNVLVKRKVTSPKQIKTLKALVRRGYKGVTALELSNTWALRLADYVFQLRRGFDLNIETVREEHEGGWHGRYVLITNVEIL